MRFAKIISLIGILLFVLASCMALSGMASTNDLPAAVGGTVMVDSNAVVISPKGFWESNSVLIGTAAATNIERMVMDIAEQTYDVMMPDSLDDYFTKSQSDNRYASRETMIMSDRISVLNNWQHFSGFDLVTVLDNLDLYLGTIQAGGTTGSIVNVTTNLYLTTGTTNAAGIYVEFVPTAYSPVNNTAEEHLRSIDSRLLYLRNLIAEIGTDTTTRTLSSVVISGDAIAQEGSSVPYTLMALFSDSSSSNISENASWSFVPAPPSTNVYFTSNVLHIGSFVWDTNITIKAVWSINGISKEDTHAVSLLDTNPPMLQAVYIVGTNTVQELQSAQYRAFAVSDQGITNEVTQQATWSVSGAPAGSVMTNSILYAGEVSSNINVIVQAQYALDSIIKSGTNAVTIAGLSQNLIITINYDGVYNVGTLHLDCYNNRRMQNWPLQQWTIPGFSAYGTHTFTNTLSSQFTGDTYWYAWLDTDGNNILNGVMTKTNTDPPTVRIDEPAGIAINQPVSMLSGCDKAFSFTLTDLAPGKHVRMGWLASDAGGTPRKRFTVYNNNAYVLQSSVLTNRTYFCEWDDVAGNFTTGSTNGVMTSGNNVSIFRLLNVYVNGTDDASNFATGIIIPWP